MKILVIAPHPDDEVLGMGGTIKKLSPKNNITLLIMTDGASAQYSDKKMIKVRRESCKKSSKILGISEIKFLNFQDMKLDSVPQLEINQEIEKIIKKIQPKIVFTSPKNDLNRDHDVTFNSTLVATRPSSSGVKKVFSYELPGYTKNPFSPNHYEDITKQFVHKIKAFKMYKSEIMKFPHPRSIESIENLAVYRGIQAGIAKAESFELIRNIE
jgi:N-acetylglucosamine malate deacetylase 1